jgi:hypothetical protein
VGHQRDVSFFPIPSASHNQPEELALFHYLSFYARGLLHLEPLMMTAVLSRERLDDLQSPYRNRSRVSPAQLSIGIVASLVIWSAEHVLNLAQ